MGAVPWNPPHHQRYLYSVTFYFLINTIAWKTRFAGRVFQKRFIGPHESNKEFGVGIDHSPSTFTFPIHNHINQYFVYLHAHTRIHTIVTLLISRTQDISQIEHQRSELIIVRTLNQNRLTSTHQNSIYFETREEKMLDFVFIQTD